MLKEKDKRIILTLAACDMNVLEAARRLYLSRNGYVYHLDKIKHLTGLDPRNFYDLYKLVELARSEETKE